MVLASFCVRILVCIVGVLLYLVGNPRPDRVKESTMKTENPNAEKRLLRMRRMFEINGGILLEDYEYFTRQGEPTRQSKGTRRSAEQRERPALRRS